MGGNTFIDGGALIEVEVKGPIFAMILYVEVEAGIEVAMEPFGVAFCFAAAIYNKPVATAADKVLGRGEGSFWNFELHREIFY